MHSSKGLFISLTGVLVGFGLIMVHSASITSWPNTFEQVYLTRHAVFLVLAAGIGGMCSLCPPRFWRAVSPYLFVLTLVLLILVLVPGIGTQVNGARRWLRAGGISVQPSEIAKITLPLFMGRILIQYRPSIRHWFWGTAPLLAPLLLLAPLVLVEPDLGTTLFLSITGALLLWLGGWPFRNYVIGLAAAAPCAGLVFSMRPYQLSRIQGFLDTWRDVNQAPYQIRQSLLTLGAGGVDGVGVGRGWQKLSFLPEANTDFVFSVVGEELGLLGTLCLVGIWCCLLLAGYSVLRRQDRGSYQYIVGLTLLFELVLQAAINTAVVTAVLPPKGISHPFLSYGGSNLIVSLAGIGIVLGLSSDGGSNAVSNHPKEGASVRLAQE